MPPSMTPELSFLFRKENVGEEAIRALAEGKVLTVRTLGNIAKDEDYLRVLAREDLKMASTTLADKAKISGFISAWKAARVRSEEYDKTDWDGMRDAHDEKYEDIELEKAFFQVPCGNLAISP